MVKKSMKLHAIVFPMPYQGHINPSVNLAIKLASKGLRVTYVITQYIHHVLTKAQRDGACMFSEARKLGLEISCSTISDGFPLDFDRTANFDEFWDSIFQDFPATVDEFIAQTIRSDQNSTPFLIVDTFFSWFPPVAEKYNLVAVSFWTQPALVFSIGFHLDLLTQNGHFPWKDNVEEEISYLPGVKTISTKHFMPYFTESEIDSTVSIVSLKAFEAVKKADFVLAAAVDELEPEVLSALNREKPVYAIGPVNIIKNFTTFTIATSFWEESDCNKWLKSKPPSSVLYVSFGSMARVSRQEFQEIAYGLLLSEVNFIWVVRADILSSGEVDIFPAGFFDELKDKGLIIPWCDQTSVLSNPAIGGFLTHCGWNSVCESMSFGVPMICYPLIFEQPANRKLVVDDWKIGMDLFDGAVHDRARAAENIKSLMNGARSQRLREEVRKVQTILQKAVEIEGCSERQLEQFLTDLRNKIHL